MQHETEFLSFDFLSALAHPIPSFDKTLGHHSSLHVSRLLFDVDEFVFSCVFFKVSHDGFLAFGPIDVVSSCFGELEGGNCSGKPYLFHVDGVFSSASLVERVVFLFAVFLHFVEPFDVFFGEIYFVLGVVVEVEEVLSLFSPKIKEGH